MIMSADCLFRFFFVSYTAGSAGAAKCLCVSVCLRLWSLAFGGCDHLAARVINPLKEFGLT